MNIIKKITRGFVNIVLVLFIILLAIFMMSKYVFKDNTPNVLGFTVLKVISGSMEPTIKVNDYVVIKLSSDYSENDIVTYQDKNKNLITHRIIMLDDKNVVTKGDNNNIEDEPITKNNIEGKVVLIINNLFKSFNTINVIITLFIVFFIGCLITVIIPDKKRG